jgi:hypothetical protein
MDRCIILVNARYYQGTGGKSAAWGWRKRNAETPTRFTLDSLLIVLQPSLPSIDNNINNSYYTYTVYTTGILPSVAIER